ncbi:HAMP domain-containing histidine kinase [Ramlibacter terrae]|uniref:histidine kinase n=1 Tax=Ramlibacter terrae TaxID=2732511 RepID=A0ABX6P5W9_9BURK|nr:HAMP domain-containing histidine kinase [Ramlibacter terrae]
MRKATLDLHAVVSEAVNELVLAFPERSLRHERAGHAVVEADADRLVQVLGNPVGNAVSYGAPDRPITISTSGETARVELAVHNEGPPIPANPVARLFEPMVRGDPQSTGGRGVGLGLYIVREIARAHGGTVHVRSGVGEGTRFVVVLPGGEVGSGMRVTGWMRELAGGGCGDWVSRG